MGIVLNKVMYIEFDCVLIFILVFVLLCVFLVLWN